MRDREKVNANSKAWQSRNVRYFLCAMAKRRAKVRGIAFNITRDDIPEIPDICPIALIPIFRRNDGTRGPCDNSPTLDRVDPAKGYTKDNIRIISHRGNRWKSEMAIGDVRKLLAYCEGKTEDPNATAS